MKRFFLLLVVALAIAALVASAAVASCIRMTAAEQRARAQVIFDGVAVEGPTATGVQRFRVSRYLKGDGPKVVRVDTGFKRRADGTGSITSVSLHVRRGERWRILGKGSARTVVRSNVCDGSRKLP
jgi:hypothetical protein